MNPYDILEIPQGAGPEEIKAAYHRLAKQWHPDRFSGAAKVEAEAKFRSLAEAFSMIKDAPRRAEAEPPRPVTSIPASQVQRPAPSSPLPQPSQSSQSSPSFGVPAPRATAVSPPPPTKGVEDFYRDAMTALENGEPETTVGLAHYILRQEPKRAEFHLLLAKGLAASGGDRRLLVKTLESAIQIDPKNAESLVMLSEVYLEMGMTARSAGMLEKLRAIDPKNKALKVAKAPARPVASAPSVSEPQSLGGQFSTLLGQLKSTLSRFKRS